LRRVRTAGEPRRECSDHVREHDEPQREQGDEDGVDAGLGVDAELARDRVPSEAAEQQAQRHADDERDGHEGRGLRRHGECTLPPAEPEHLEHCELEPAASH
jgi:hypothetical protein